MESASKALILQSLNLSVSPAGGGACWSAETHEAESKKQTCFSGNVNAERGWNFPETPVEQYTAI